MTTPARTPTGPPARTVFLVSDHTGLTAESVARSLLAHFEAVRFAYQTRPFVASEADVALIAAEIRALADAGAPRPLVFSTLTEPALLAPLHASPALVFDLFGPYLGALEPELGPPSPLLVGRYHSMSDPGSYFERIEALDFALGTDDGLGDKHYERAEVILVGVSRAGKTPTCLFLGLQYGVRAANYPLADEDFERARLPAPLQPHRAKLYGLSLSAERLHSIRSARRPGSSYASLERCRYELRGAEALFRAHAVPTFDATASSIEEIAASIVQRVRLAYRPG